MFKMVIGVRASMWSLLLLVMAIPASADQRVSCTSDPLVVACFGSYKTTLRSFHGRQLDAIADRISASRSWKLPVNYITVVGHSAKFKSTDPVEENAKGRADSVAQALTKKLKQRGVTRFKIVKGSFGASEPRATNSTREGRQLNRRAEIILGSQENVIRRVDTLKELCTGKKGRSSTKVLKSPSICRDLTQAHETCWSELSQTARKTYFGAGCQPLFLYCVLCREG